jgi:enamine deaminase RidA (YjgF/YER057c/UK114 family)
MMPKRELFHLRPDGEKAFGYAQAVRSGATLFVAGTLAVDDGFAPVHAGDMAAQIGAAYAAIRETLAAHGGTLADVVRETVYVTDMDAFIAANGARTAAYAGWLPAATAVEVKRLAFPECMVEIEVTAIL